MLVYLNPKPDPKTHPEISLPGSERPRREQGHRSADFGPGSIEGSKGVCAVSPVHAFVRGALCCTVLRIGARKTRLGYKRIGLQVCCH